MDDENTFLLFIIPDQWILEMGSFLWKYLNTTILNEYLSKKKGNKFMILHYLLGAYKIHFINSKMNTIKCLK